MQETILLVDDNPIQAATRQSILKQAGYFVIAVLNPVRALEQFRNREFPSAIQLVITDHLMPGMNGNEFIAAVRELEPDVPALVISGLPDVEDHYPPGTVEFLYKPVMPDVLLATVRRILSRAA